MTSACAIDAKIEVPKQDFDAIQTKLHDLQKENAALAEQLAWFKRQVFGVKSEKRFASEAEQASLFSAAQASTLDSQPATIDVPAHKRQKHRTGTEVNDSGMRFGRTCRYARSCCHVRSSPGPMPISTS